MTKNNRKYSKEQKESILNKLFEQNGITVPDISAQTGIPQTTIYSWKTRFLRKNKNLSDKNSGEKGSAPNSKFQIVMQTYGMTEYDLGKYCRENALYVDNVKKWRSELESALEKEPVAVKEIKEELSKEKQKVRSLEKELNRKEKALAEAAALLVLRKKYQAFMEEKVDS